jgi:hypothetical protein
MKSVEEKKTGIDGACEELGTLNPDHPGFLRALGDIQDDLVDEAISACEQQRNDDVKKALLLSKDIVLLKKMFRPRTVRSGMGV